MVDALLAVAAVVLVVIGGRVRAGHSSATTWMQLPGRRQGDGRDEARAHRTAGRALEVAGMLCLVGAVAVATIRNRHDVDLDDLVVALVAVVAVAVVLAVGRRRTAAVVAGETDEHDRR